MDAGRTLRARMLVALAAVACGFVPAGSAAAQELPAPSCGDQSVGTAEGTAVRITLACTGTIDAYDVSTATRGGVTRETGNTVVYTPSAGFTGTDSFRFSAKNGTVAPAKQQAKRKPGNLLSAIGPALFGAKAPAFACPATATNDCVVKAIATIKSASGHARAADAKHSGGVAARETFRIAPGASRQIRLELTPLARRELRSHGDLPITVTIEVQLPGAEPQQRSRAVTLRK